MRVLLKYICFYIYIYNNYFAEFALAAFIFSLRILVYSELSIMAFIHVLAQTVSERKKTEIINQVCYRYRNYSISMMC